MVDLDPEIWKNKTLGSAANNENLDRLEMQLREDRSARLEGRESREVVVENDYPAWEPERRETRPSWANHVHFADEKPNDAIYGGEESQEVTDEKQSELSRQTREMVQEKKEINEGESPGATESQSEYDKAVAAKRTSSRTTAKSEEKKS